MSNSDAPAVNARNERLRLWLNFASVLVVSGAVTALGSILNHQIQAKQVELDRQEREAKIRLEAQQAEQS